MLAFTSRPWVSGGVTGRVRTGNRLVHNQGLYRFELRPPWIASAGIEPAWRSRMRAAGSPDPTRRGVHASGRNRTSGLELRTLAFCPVNYRGI